MRLGEFRGSLPKKGENHKNILKHLGREAHFLLSHLRCPFLFLFFPVYGVFWLAPLSLGEETVQVLLMFYRFADNALTVGPLVSREKWWLGNAFAM
jgi:hypothetical protein